jgi:hypothetical protein
LPTAITSGTPTPRYPAAPTADGRRFLWQTGIVCGRLR